MVNTMNKWTRKRILDTFTELVNEHGYDAVTIQMILEKAEIGKTSFYRYFRNKSDLLYGHYEDLYDAAVEDEQCNDVTDLFILLLKITRENPEELSMFDTIGYESYREFIYKYTYARGKEILETAWKRQLTEKEKFHVAFFCGGGARILEEYACGKYRNMTPEEAGKAVASMASDRYRVTIDKPAYRKKKTKR